MPEPVPPKVRPVKLRPAWWPAVEWGFGVFLGAFVLAAGLFFLFAPAGLAAILP